MQTWLNTMLCWFHAQPNFPIFVIYLAGLEMPLDQESLVLSWSTALESGQVMCYGQHLCIPKNYHLCHCTTLIHTKKFIIYVIAARYSNIFYWIPKSNTISTELALKATFESKVFKHFWTGACVLRTKIMLFWYIYDTLTKKLVPTPNANLAQILRFIMF